MFTRWKNNLSALWMGLRLSVFLWLHGWRATKMSVETVEPPADGKPYALQQDVDEQGRVTRSRRYNVDTQQWEEWLDNPITE